jgi:hypothetical protein
MSLISCAAERRAVGEHVYRQLDGADAEQPHAIRGIVSCCCCGPERSEFWGSSDLTLGFLSSRKSYLVASGQLQGRGLPEAFPALIYSTDLKDAKAFGE